MKKKNAYQSHSIYDMKIKSICIVGGGSSGWMMALALQNKLPDLDVTLIESPNFPTIGVGESTIPYTTEFIANVLGFEEKEWMPYCDATYKAAIRFTDFTKKKEKVYHPFFTFDEADINGFNWAIKKAITNTPIEDYFESHYIAYHMCKDNKFDRLDSKGFSYAHHLDAVKFAMFCKSKFKGRHILATVNDVDTIDNKITRIKTDKGIYQADFFIDCTGFNALLLGKALKEPFNSISDTLLNDTAITCRVPYENKNKELEPFTDCTALSSGWAWNTPLWSRIGTGYVFSSKFQTLLHAKKEFKMYLEKRYGKKRIKDCTFNQIKFKTGKYERSWVGNCLALTLASGFIEPLESTGLAIIGLQITEFIKAIEDKCPTCKGYEYSALGRSMCNAEIDSTFNEVHFFVLLHYVNTQRTDSPYWDYIRNEIETSKEFNQYVRDIGSLENSKYRWFKNKSNECISLGFDLPSNYSIHNLHWEDRLFLSLTTKEKDKILDSLTYLDFLKAEYGFLTKKMLPLLDYMKQEIY